VHGDPIGYKVLRKGTPVVYSDGVELGTVDQVRDNAREHIFDGLVVRTTGGKVFVDAPEVDRIYERRVELNVVSGTSFEEWRGWRGALETRAKRRIERLKRR
jgi:sporulation protein YlmC with PRC-barrel domain